MTHQVPPPLLLLLLLSLKDLCRRIARISTRQQTEENRLLSQHSFGFVLSDLKFDLSFSFLSFLLFRVLSYPISSAIRSGSTFIFFRSSDVSSCTPLWTLYLFLPKEFHASIHNSSFFAHQHDRSFQNNIEPGTGALGGTTMKYPTITPSIIEFYWVDAPLLWTADSEIWTRERSTSRALTQFTTLIDRLEEWNWGNRGMSISQTLSHEV